MFGGILKFIQDFIAPIFLFLKAEYTLNIKKAGDILSSGEVNMTSEITRKIAGREAGKNQFSINIKENGVFEIEIQTKDLKISMECRNELQ
jgi:hypothetical protein